MKDTLQILPNIRLKDGVWQPFNTPLSAEIALPKAKILGKLMDFFTTNHISVKISDPLTGLVQTDLMGLGSHYNVSGAKLTAEDWVICERKYEIGRDSFVRYPNTVSGELQVFVQEISPTRCKINLSLFNFKAIQQTEDGDSEPFSAASSLNFEKMLVNYLSNDTAAVPLVKLDFASAYFTEPVAQQTRRVEISQQRHKNFERKQNLWFPLVTGLIIAFFVIYKKIID